MLGFLRDHPYVFSLAVVLLTATLVWLYARTLEKDSEKVNKTFYKTLFAGVIAALTLSWLVYRQEPVCTEPFTTDG